MLHIGIVGMGGIGNNHARCYDGKRERKGRRRVRYG